MWLEKNSTVIVNSGSNILKLILHNFKNEKRKMKTNIIHILSGKKPERYYRSCQCLDSLDNVLTAVKL